MVEWLMAEMAENRDKFFTKDKHYNCSEVVHALQRGGPVERHWGSETFCRKLLHKPELLQLRGP